MRNVGIIIAIISKNMKFVQQLTSFAIGMLAMGEQASAAETEGHRMHLNQFMSETGGLT